jgi:hypothetical protein
MQDRDCKAPATWQDSGSTPGAQSGGEG